MRVVSETEVRPILVLRCPTVNGLYDCAVIFHRAKRKEVLHLGRHSAVAKGWIERGPLRNAQK